MKRYHLFIFTAALLILSACTDKKKQLTREEQIAEFRSELTAEDTTTMLKLADEAMEQLKAKKIDQVIASLYEYNDSTKEAKPVTEKTASRYHKMFSFYPVIDYTRVYYSFMLEGCNDVKYEVTFATAEQLGTDKPATTMFMFNPIKLNGEWKLCVKTPLDQVDTTRN